MSRPKKTESPGGTAVAEKPTTATAGTNGTNGTQNTLEWPTSAEERQEFEAKMERELAQGEADAGFLGIAQRNYDRLGEQIAKLQSDQAAYKALLDHFGSAGR